MKIESLPPASAEQPVRKPPRRWRKPVIALAVLALAGAGGYADTHRGRAARASRRGGKKRRPCTNCRRATSPGSRRVRWPSRCRCPGSLTPLAQATVKSKVSGVVLADHRAGRHERGAGQVIAQLDDAEARARVAQQQAHAGRSQRAPGAGEEEPRPTAQALLKQNYIAQNAYDTTRNSVDLAQAAVDSARAQLDLARIALNDTSSARRSPAWSASATRRPAKSCRRTAR
jgi:membrane fusion protein (multidrug efflux system)